MKYLFRIVRNTLVLRMRAQGMTWAAINKVLVAMDQKVIVKATETPGGCIVHYGKYNPRLGLTQKRRRK